MMTESDTLMYYAVIDAANKATNSLMGMFGYLEENGALVVPVLRGSVFSQCRIFRGTNVIQSEALNSTIFGRVIAEKRTTRINTPLPYISHDCMAILRAMITPILHQDMVIGLLGVANKPDSYDENDLTVLETIARSMSTLLATHLERGRQMRVWNEADQGFKKIRSVYSPHLEPAASDFIPATGQHRDAGETSARLHPMHLRKSHAQTPGGQTETSWREVEQFNCLLDSRELRMIEMKKQINELARQLGQPAAYDDTIAG